jgi:outer membrane protein assembly factor BamD (BamD/ComL family)
VYVIGESVGLWEQHIRSRTCIIAWHTTHVKQDHIAFLQLLLVQIAILWQVHDHAAGRRAFSQFSELSLEP